MIIDTIRIIRIVQGVVAGRKLGGGWSRNDDPNRQRMDVEISTSHYTSDMPPELSGNVNAYVRKIVNEYWKKVSYELDYLFEGIDENQKNYEKEMELFAKTVHYNLCKTVPNFKNKDPEEQKAEVQRYLKHARYYYIPKLDAIEQRLHIANLKTLGISQERQGKLKVRFVNIYYENMEEWDGVRKALTSMEGFIDKAMIPDKKLSFYLVDSADKTKPDRSGYGNGDEPFINLEGVKQQNDVSVIAHEIGHFIEHNSPGVKRICQDFLNARTEGEKPQSLNKLMNDSAYDDIETARPDHFPNPYCGKIYSDGATELLSMGIQMFATEPREFYNQDPEYFILVWGIVRGDFKNYKQGA